MMAVGITNCGLLLPAHPIFVNPVPLSITIGNIGKYVVNSLKFFYDPIIFHMMILDLAKTHATERASEGILQ